MRAVRATLVVAPARIVCRAMFAASVCPVAWTLVWAVPAAMLAWRFAHGQPVLSWVIGWLLAAVVLLVISGALSLFGVIHSVELSGGVYLPWLLDAASRGVVWQFAGAYLVLAVVLMLLSLGGTRPLATKRADH